MAIEHETTTDDIDALRGGDGALDARSKNGNGTPISKEQCAAMRLALDLHVRKTTIATIAGVSATAVSNHVRGQCRHDHEETDA